MNFILSQPSTTLDIYTHAFDKNKKGRQRGLAGDAGDMNIVSIEITVALCGELWYVLWLQREGYHVRLHESLAGTV